MTDIYTHTKHTHVWVNHVCIHTPHPHVQTHTYTMQTVYLLLVYTTTKAQLRFIAYPTAVLWVSPHPWLTYKYDYLHSEIFYQITWSFARFPGDQLNQICHKTWIIIIVSVSSSKWLVKSFLMNLVCQILVTILILSKLQ
jgi:hypothetical protein